MDNVLQKHICEALLAKSPRMLCNYLKKTTTSKAFLDDVNLLRVIKWANKTAYTKMERSSV
jgi:hypothetical protein